MGKTINTKSTKTEIYEAYMEMKEKLDALDAMKDDPLKEKRNAEVAAMKKDADKLVKMDILRPDIVDQYLNLEREIEARKTSIKQLYDIEVQANTMTALINVYKEKEVELRERYKNLESDLEKSLEQKRDDLQMQLIALKEEKTEVCEQIKKESIALQSELNEKRKREEEQYNYDLNRKRRKSDDDWEDEKAVREKIMAEKEQELKGREQDLSIREEKISEMEEKIAMIPAMIEEAKALGIEKGKSDANKNYVFEIRNITTKNEYETANLQNQIKDLTERLNEAKETNLLLQQKLDTSYTEMKELAAQTVRSAGGVKILDRENTTK